MGSKMLPTPLPTYSAARNITQLANGRLLFKNSPVADWMHDRKKELEEAHTEFPLTATVEFFASTYELVVYREDAEKTSSSPFSFPIYRSVRYSFPATTPGGAAYTAMLLL